jgi:hypothetical protein
MTLSVLLHQLAACLNEYGDVRVVVDGVEARDVVLSEDANGDKFLEIL